MQLGDASKNLNTLRDPTMRFSCIILIEDYLELFFGHPPSKPSLTEAHVQPLWGELTFPQDTIPTNYGSNGVSRDVQLACDRGVRSEAKFLFRVHETNHAILAPTHLRGTPPNRIKFLFYCANNVP